MNELVFFVNGKRRVVRGGVGGFPPLATVDKYLRSIGLMGTKTADEEGMTGIDTVVVIDTVNGQQRIRPVLSSITLLASCHGKDIITVEGLGSLEKMHPIQKQFTECDASQCGFCLGGVVMTLYSLLRRKNGDITCNDIEENFDGNFCRCTGYAPLAAAAAAFAKDAPEDMLTRWDVTRQTFDVKSEPALPELFPSSATDYSSQRETQSGELAEIQRFVAPAKLAELVALLKENPNALMVGGNTHTLSNRNPMEPLAISTLAVEELLALTSSEDTFTIGGSRTITELHECLAKMTKHRALHDADLMMRFALSNHRRNIATVGGELAYALAEPDVAIILASLNATVTALCGAGLEQKTLKITEIGSSNVRLILSVSVNAADTHECYVYPFREAQRRVNHRPYFSGSVTYCPTSKSTIIYLAGLKGYDNEYSRVSSFPEAAKEFTEIVFSQSEGKLLPTHEVAKRVASKIQVPDVDHHSSYRRLAIRGYFEKAAYLIRSMQKVEALPADLHLFPERTTGLPRTYRTWPEATVTKSVGTYTKMSTAASKATGDVRYTIDEYRPQMLFGALVLGQKPGYKLIGFDTKEALAIPGVIDFACAKDIPGKNVHSGIPPADTKVFQDDVILHFNEPVGIIMAESGAIAAEAAKRVKVIYGEKVAEVYPDIKSAMAANAYHPNNDVGAMVLIGGDLEKAYKEADGILEGEVFAAGQDHTYTEVINAVTIPEQDGNWTLMVSSQNMSKCQSDVATVLNISASKVTSKVYHLGGGYGGKQDRPCVFATACAVGANKVKRPVKLVLSRQLNMLIAGGRHPFLYQYKVSYKKDGALTGADILLVADGGSTYDVTTAVLNKALFQCNGPYTIPNFRCEGRSAKTARVTNTAYRGFGGPQGEFIIEHILQEISYATGLTPEAVRVRNLNREGDINISGTYNQKGLRSAEDIPERCWKRLSTSTDILERAQKDREFNKQNKNIKRAVGFCNVRNATLFEERWMNQASSLVHVIKDGTVVVAHSGVEMGQGLHEKVRLAVCEILPVTRAQVRILETSTDTCANTQPTSASSGPDLNIPAVVDACKNILARLQPRLDKGMNWNAAVITAYFDGVDLHSSSFFSGPYDLQYTWEFHKPGPSRGPTGLYNGYGSAAVEVELDVLTGSYRFMRADVIEDAGRPMNPRTDLGQVEGGFVQGTGWLTTEDLAWDNDGHQLANGLAAYACPSISDVPSVLHSMLLENAPNDSSHAFKSKACEETPTLFGSASFFAVKDAVAAARADRGKFGPFRMDGPASKHSILKLIYGDE